MNACGQGQRPEPWEVLKVWKLPPFFLVIGSLVVLASHLFLVASKFTAILWSASVIFGWDGWNVTCKWTGLRNLYLQICPYLQLKMTQFHPWRLGPESSTTRRSPGAKDSMRCEGPSCFKIWVVFPTKIISWHWHVQREHGSFFLLYLGIWVWPSMKPQIFVYCPDVSILFWVTSQLSHMGVTKTRNWMYIGPSIEMVVPRGCAHVKRCFHMFSAFTWTRKYKILGRFWDRSNKTS